MQKKIAIKTKLPGPKAKKIVERDHAILSPSFTRSYPFVAHKAEGVWMQDPDGNTFLDMTAGIAVTATGHCHPDVVRAIKAQADKFLHMSGTDFYYEAQVKLAEKLVKHVPGKAKKRVFFTNSGAESVEAAFKLARYKTGRHRMIAFYGAFHGRTLGALSLTGSKMIQKEKFGPLVPGVTHVDYPNAYRNEMGTDDPEKLAQACVDYIENTVFKRICPPNEVAAVIVEAIQGEGGYIVPPASFHKRLRALTKKHGILLIFDEVQAGMGRTGKMFAVQHWPGVEPDMITTAKGIASGLPLGAMIAKASIMDWEPGAHASTFGGNPIACEAALATINLLEKKLMKNATVVGKHLMDKLNQLARQYPMIGDVRGIGLMVGIEIVKDRHTKAIDPKMRDKIVDEAFKRGVLLLGCGDSGIRFSPGLVITKKEVDICMKVLDEVFKKLS